MTKLHLLISPNNVVGTLQDYDLFNTGVDLMSGNHEDFDVERTTTINKNDIEHLEKSLQENKEAVEKLTDRIKGNSDTDGLIARVSSLETKFKIIMAGSGIILSAVISQFFV